MQVVGILKFTGLRRTKFSRKFTSGRTFWNFGVYGTSWNSEDKGGEEKKLFNSNHISLPRCLTTRTKLIFHPPLHSFLLKAVSEGKGKRIVFAPTSSSLTTFYIDCNMPRICFHRAGEGDGGLFRRNGILPRNFLWSQDLNLWN